MILFMNMLNSIIDLTIFFKTEILLVSGNDAVWPGDATSCCSHRRAIHQSEGRRYCDM